MAQLIRLVVVSMLLAMAYPVAAQETGGPAPAVVQTANVTRGTITPQTQFVGSIKYPEVAEVAAEVSGKVQEVRFEQGERVEQGAVLVSLNADLLRKELRAAEAAHARARAHLDRTRKDLGRIRNLYQQESVAEKLYDDNRFTVLESEQQVAALKAQLERVQVELAKKQVEAPFAGVILERLADRGEWVTPGKGIALLARDDVVDALVHVPEKVMSYCRVGVEAPVTIASSRTLGIIVAIIPEGDVPTRSFPVKVRLKNTGHFAQGMEARVLLPAEPPVEALIVPRDAVITAFGRTIVYAVVEGKAKMIPVQSVLYSGEQAGLTAAGLEPGMQVVTKGNERIRNGQPVRPVPTGKQG